MQYYISLLKHNFLYICILHSERYYFSKLSLPVMYTLNFNDTLLKLTVIVTSSGNNIRRVYCCLMSDDNDDDDDDNVLLPVHKQVSSYYEKGTLLRH